MRRVAAKWVYRSEERLLDNAVVVLANDYVGNYYAISDVICDTYKRCFDWKTIREIVG